ncbi:MAG: hypothetical protein ACREP9_01800, partial [Candidatus Dormibacteraceae bacterium]
MSYMASGRGDLRRAERMLAQAMEYINPVDSPHIASWLEAYRAEELAQLGDTAALPLLESSLRHYMNPPKSDSFWGSFLTPARMDIFALNIHLHFGRHHDAESLATRVMESVSAESTLRPVVLTDVATVYLKSGNFEQGTDIAAQAYQAVATT